MEILFSIIIPVSHGGSFLRKALVSLCEMDYPPERFEVVVAGNKDDQNSQKITDEIAKIAEFDLRYVCSSESKIAAELNAAFHASHGKVLAFADDDCIFLPDWLKRLHEIFDLEPNAGIVGGVDELINNRSGFNQALDYVLNSPLGTGGFRGLKKSSFGRYYPKLWNMAITREAASNISLVSNQRIPELFNESLVVYEDIELARRIEKTGKGIVFSPYLRIRHHRDTNIVSFFKRNFNMARTSRSLGIHKIPHVSATLSFVSLFTLGILSFLFKPVLIAFSIFLGAYIISLLAGAVIGSIKKRRGTLILMVPVLIVSLHLSRSLGYLIPWHYRRTLEGRI